MERKKELPDVESFHDASSKTSMNTNPKWSRCRIIKNLLCSSCGIFFLFTGFEGVTQLQSTINSRKGMGLASQAVIYAFFCLSALFLPTITIRKLGCKLTLTLSLLAYCPYIASNFYPEWSTLIPSAALVGITASLLWASVCTYLNKLSVTYKEHVGAENVESVAALFFGISGAFQLFSYISGNLISFFVLDQQNSSSVTDNQSHCGIDFVENDVMTKNNTNLEPPSKDLRNMLVGILLSSGVFAVLLVALILDPLHYADDEEFSLTRKLTATFRVMKRRDQLLMMPLTLYIGLHEGFYAGDFTRIYIACAWGVHHIGLVTICLGLSSAICSTSSGWMRKYTGRIPICTVAALANIATFILCFVWLPDSRKPYMFFICSSLWGIFNGIYLTQIRALYGQLFRGEEEPAFANFYLWTSIGHFLSFSYSRYLSIATKLYLLIVVFALGQIGYMVVEYRVRYFANNEKIISQNEHASNYKCKEDDQQS